MKLKDAESFEDFSPVPVAEIPLKPVATLDEQEEAAQEMAAKIVDFLRTLAKAHSQLEDIGAGDATKNKFVQLTRQVYTNIKMDIPHLWRPSLVEQIDEELGI